MVKKNLIYIADDAQSMTDLLKEVVKGNFPSYLVKTFEDGDSLYKSILENQEGLELVLTDYEMPLMSGLEVIKKCSGEYPDVPFILMSGRNVGYNAKKAGAKEFLMKPFKIQDLVNTLKKYLKDERD